MNISEIIIHHITCHICLSETESYMKVELEINKKVEICSQACLNHFREARKKVDKPKMKHYPVNAPNS